MGERRVRVEGDEVAVVGSLRPVVRAAFEDALPMVIEVRASSGLS